MTMIARLRLLAATALLLAAPGAARAQESGLPIGSAPPSAMLQTLDGKTVDLAQLVGKGPAVVEFWATWCESCDHLLPTVQRVHARYGTRVKFIGVSVSVNQSVRRVVVAVCCPSSQPLHSDWLWARSVLGRRSMVYPDGPAPFS